MPATQEPQQQAPMEMTATDGVVTQQPVSTPTYLSNTTIPIPWVKHIDRTEMTD